MLAYLRVLEARNPETSAERLRTLAGDEVRPVRLWVARNPHTPPDVLDALIRDEDSSVLWNALLHPKTPDAALRWLSERETASDGRRHFLYRQKVVHHPNASIKLRAELIAMGACACPQWCGGRRVYDDSVLRRWTAELFSLVLRRR